MAMLRSTRIRLTLLFAALMIGTFLVAGLGSWAAARIAGTRDVQHRINGETAALQAAYARGGRSAVAAEIRRRTSYPTTFGYRLSDAAGRTTLAGDATLPNQSQGWEFTELDPLPGGPHRGDVQAFNTVLAGGERLTITDDMERPETIRDAVLGALIWTGLASLTVGLAVGFWATRAAFRRLTLLTSTVQTVAEGDLTVRAPIRNLRQPDDIDDLIGSFNTMLDRIDALVASVGRVSTNVAHDLRTPLTRIERRLSLLAEAATPEARQAEIDAVREEIRRLLRASDAVMRLAEIEKGVMKADFVELDLAPLIDQVAHAYRPDIEAAGHTFEVRQEGGATVLGQPHLLVQAMANLLENAMRHSRGPTAIQLQLQSGPDGERIVVSDSGPGIAAAQRERVLEPFERLEESRTTPGSGLGLSIVHAIAKLHGASFVLEDAEPGLRVVMSLPRHRAGAVPASPPLRAVVAPEH